MLSDYISKTMGLARYKLLEDGTYFGEIPGLKGLWSNAKNLEICRNDLEQVLEDWLFLKIRAGEKVSGFEIKVDRREMLSYA